MAAVPFCRRGRQRGVWWRRVSRAVRVLSAGTRVDAGRRRRRRDGPRGRCPVNTLDVECRHTAVGLLALSASYARRYDTRCDFNVRSKADKSRLNLPHRTKLKKRGLAVEISNFSKSNMTAAAILKITKIAISP